MEQIPVTNQAKITTKVTKDDLDDKTCGVTKTIRIIGSKWTILILYNLLTGPRRFGELQKILAHLGDLDKILPTFKDNSNLSRPL